MNINQGGFDARMVAQFLGGEVIDASNILAPGPGHSPKDRSMSITLDPAAPDGFLVNSFAGDDWQQCKEHVAERLGLPKWRASASPRIISGQVKRKASVEPPKDEPFFDGHLIRQGFTCNNVYPYHDADGLLLYEVLRFDHPTEPKTFIARRPGPDGSWLKGAGTKRVLYRSEDRAKFFHRSVFLCEGEKDCDRLASLDLLAVTVAFGKWSEEAVRDLDGYSCVILEDNDAAGRKKALAAAEAVRGVASAVRILSLPDLPERGDVSDWLDRGGDRDQLIAIARATPVWGEDAPPPPPPDDGEPWNWDERDPPGPEPVAPIILSSSEFVAGFTPPDYLVDGLLQRRFFYSNTGATGSGKTTLTLLLAANVARGLPFAGREVEAGRVLFFAGENPDDIRMRWLLLADAESFDINTIDVHFVPGRFSMTELGDRVRQEVSALGGVALLLIDTSAAYFEGDNENDNVQAGNHARLMRSFTTLEGGPTVIANCHPVKNAGADNLLPRGGGAFIAEVDGNLTSTKSDTVVSLHWAGKFRGPDFQATAFELVSATAPQLKDSKGRSIYTVHARVISDAEQRDKAKLARSDEDEVLVLLLNSEGDLTPVSIASQLNWLMKTGEPYRVKASRVLKKLSDDKLVKLVRGNPTLTDLGNKQAKKVDYNQKTAGASYG